MKIPILIAGHALVLASLPTPLAAQAMNMSGMPMPMGRMKPTPVARPAHKKAPATKAPLTKHRSGNRKPSAPETASVPGAHQGHEKVSSPITDAPRATGSSPMNPPTMPSMPSGTMSMPAPAQSATGAGAMTMPTGQMSMGDAGHAMRGTGAYGGYPEQRESSGTSWQPDASSATGGPMLMAGDWMLMAHGVVSLVYDHQSGPRGDDKAFASGMLMGMARHPLGDGTLQLRAMLSPDPLMGPSGYPLLLASGETANGRTPLVDRQHPHDFFMELSGSVSQNLGAKSSVFVYAGLPGEPAFGPPAFMHRESILDSPEAPITHHWLDSTHIAFGVLTAGLVFDRVKLEVSRFNAREPDQHRWNIETGPLDSTSLRVSWNPARTIALQGSWGYFRNPEQLEPGVNQKRLSASALWADEIAPGWKAAATLAWGRKTIKGHNDDGLAAEASLKHAKWTLFGRAEMTENRELLGLDSNSRAFHVGKVSLGAVREFRVADHLSFGIGGLFSVNFVPKALAPLYGSQNPTGAMGFVRLRLD